MRDFISEDDLKTFEGWLKYQAVDPKTPEELKEWRCLFEEAKEHAASSLKVGLMKLQQVPGEHRYAVAVNDGGNLWLMLWVRRSKKGEFFVMVPRGDKDWNPHTSYHLDGTLHMKSYGHKSLPPPKCQPLTGAFHGTEHLGMHYGYGPKGVGAIATLQPSQGSWRFRPVCWGRSMDWSRWTLLSQAMSRWNFLTSRLFLRRSFVRSCRGW